MGADHWHATTLPAEPAVLTSDGQTVWAALASGAVYASADAGLSWALCPHGLLPAEPLALLATSGVLLAATERGVFAAATGQAWVQAPLGLPADDLVMLLAGAESHVIASTFSSGLFRTRFAPVEWTATDLFAPSRAHRHSVFALAYGRLGLYAAHTLGLSRSRDAGQTWESASFGLPPSILLNALFVRQTVWASGGGAIFRSDDGLTWQSVYAAGQALPLVLLACGDHVLVARAMDGPHLYRSHDGGVTWHAFSDHLPDGLFATHGLYVEDALLLNTLPAGVWRYDVSRLRTTPPPLELLPQRPDVPDEVAFVLHTEARVVLSVHDVSGREVTRLVDGGVGRGPHRYRLDAPLPPGLYEWRLSGGGSHQARSFIWLP